MLVADNSDEENSDASEEMIVSDSDEDFDFAKPKQAAKKKAARTVLSSDDDSFGGAAKKAKTTESPNVSSDDLFESLKRSTPLKSDSPSKPMSSPDVYMIGKFSTLNLSITIQRWK